MWADEGQVYQFKRCSFYINDDAGKVKHKINFCVIKNDFHVNRELFLRFHIIPFPKPNIICHVLMIFNVIP